MHQMPYNAYKFEMVVWERATGWSVIFTDEFEDLCNGIPLGRIQWDGTGASQTNVHNIELTLTNCEDTIHFADIEVHLLSLLNNVIENPENMLSIPNSDIPTNSFKKTARGNTTDKASNIVRSNVALLSVSPNPVTENTKITFNTRAASNVSLYLYNSSGIVVRTLIKDQYYNEGEYSTELDASHLLSGIYYCHLEINGSIISKKILKIQR